MSLLSKEEVHQIWLDVKANSRRLKECARPHEFVMDIDPETKVFRKSKCSKCGGALDAIEAGWYEQGLRDAILTPEHEKKP